MNRRLIIVLLALVASFVLAMPQALAYVVASDATGTSDTATTDGNATAANEPILSTCDGHALIAFHETAAGNDYALMSHTCIGRTWSTDIGGYNYHARVHYHCTRNGVAWDGCRINQRIVLQFYDNEVDHRWEQVPFTARDISTPTGTYFANSGTITSRSVHWQEFRPHSIRASIEDPDNMKFRLADNTVILKDLLDDKSAAYTPSG